MLAKNQPQTVNSCVLTSKCPEKKKLAKSRSFLHQIAASYRNTRAHPDQDKAIEVISGFPINSKVYRHYIAGNGNKCDKLTNSVEISKLIARTSRRSFSRKPSGSVRRKKAKEADSARFHTFVVRKNGQERAVDVTEPVYDSIEECGDGKPRGAALQEHFYFEEGSNSSEDLTQLQPSRLSLC